jgi:ATP-dependent DNA helicase RecQ
MVEVDTWPAARRAALLRDQYRCQKCGASDRSELDVHHRMPRSIQIDHSPANLVTLCDGCHAAIHLNLQVGLAKRTIQRWSVRLARALDFHNELPDTDLNFGPWLQLLGKSRLRDGQLPIILAVLRGDNVLAIRPTGSGKSLCFQVPILMQPGCGLVIEPLKTLMKDQVQGLHDLQLPATFISSDVPLDERRQRYDLLEAGTWKFLYMAPERFDPSVIKDQTEVERLAKFRPNHLVVDEAHTVSQYGDGFRPIYSRLSGVREQLGSPQVLAFTATASPAMQSYIKNSLGVPGATTIVENPDRSNITFARLPIGKSDPRRIDIIIQLLRQIPSGRAIIFVPTVKEGVTLQAALRGRGVDLEFFHSKAKDPAWRDNVQGRFSGRILPTVSALIATSAFGMGLDIPDIRLIVHWQHPFSIEEYVQGYGRAGRDGKHSLAVLFTDEQQDRYLLDFMTRTNETTALDDRLADVDKMAKLANNREICFRRALVAHLLGEQSPRQSWSMRILNWAFSEKQKSIQTKQCCDKCSESLSSVISEGTYSWI